MVQAMQRRITDVKNRLLEDISERAAGFDTSDLNVDFTEFVRHYYKDVWIEDLQERSPADLCAAALSHLRLGIKRKRNKPNVRVYNPTAESHGWTSPHTIVDMVNDDMPFLVDSIGMALNRHNLAIHLTVHPLLNVIRDKQGNLKRILSPGETDVHFLRESYLRFEVDREDRELFPGIEKAIVEVLGDVRAAVEDWREMHSMCLSICQALKSNPPKLDPTGVRESIALLEWMAEDHFTFLGYREYDLINDEGDYSLKPVKGTGLGILRDGRRKSSRSSGVILSNAIRKQALSKELLIITKANSVATVHRPGYLDYISVKSFKGGLPIGEKRFLGLFTSVAYSRSPREIPLLRLKVQKVMDRSGLPPSSHVGKAMMHILETFPRDELFQSSVEDLVRTATGIYHLQERQRVKLFIRRDVFKRFFSCLVYVPRERYNTQVRRRIEAILLESFKGNSVESTPELTEATLARVHSIVRTPEFKNVRFDLRAIETKIADAVRSWGDHLKHELTERFGEERALKLFAEYGDVFPAAYMEDVTPKEATFDIERMVVLGQDDEGLRMSLYRPEFFPKENLRFKVFHKEEPLPISDVLPMLENMGVRVISERPYHVKLHNDERIWIQDFEMRWTGEQPLVPAEVNEIFQETFAATWLGKAENDGFNQLVLAGRLTWRQTAVLRTYCKYLLQTGIPFSQSYMEQVLSDNAKLGTLLVKHFESRFDPDVNAAKRRDALRRSATALDRGLDSVATLDEDRILRAFLAVINATLRTNFFRVDAEGEPRPYIAVKLDCASVPDLPLPRPMFEVFVYSPRVEGVHLRMGRVARGGLRWSDRREDFRTEVLGLMKAQNVKNTLIVPMGAKGGFVAKRLPSQDRAAIQKEVVACYRHFIQGLLDITDNLVDGRVKPPRRVLRRDDDDPYLVVAADKGTATFSDTANEISASYGFWLGDAFASGGSAGYDHKKMGITARGAWEAVKRHFREIGVDTQSQDFTVAGIGDMSGDVFGNGMLLSEHIKLQAAFNHMHIFLDPDPDPQKSFQERQRLFDAAGSTWEDYDPKAISQGGGIYSRQDKTIPLSSEVKRMLDVKTDSMAPQELVRAILRMPVDLLWNGGIGTYVKASTESNSDVGDRANDAVRVNATELKCKVIGEGGNLGCTQRGRVEFALLGGRINTDFIDNSAGVDSSDREVNIKILLNLAIQDKKLDAKKRNALLASMTDEVASLVLRNNYLQTQAISMMETQAVERIREHAHLLRSMERNGELDRALEFLPTDEEITDRRKAGKGFTQPELAVILSYSKIALYGHLINSDVPEDAYLSRELERYFPAPLQRRFRTLMPKHRLSREIIATQVTNSMINRMGPVFALRMQEETGTDASAIARAYTISREIFDARELWTDIEALDNKVHASVQYSMMFQTTRLLRHATRWFVDKYSDSLDIEAAVSRLSPDVKVLRTKLPKVLSGSSAKRYEETVELYSDIGVPDDIARSMAAQHALFAALDIVEVAAQKRIEVGFSAALYFELGRGLNLDWLRDQIEHLQVEGQWQAQARATLRDNLYALQRQLLSQLLGQYQDKATAADTMVEWLAKHTKQVNHAKRVLKDMKAASEMDFATLSVAMQEIRKLCDV